MQWKLAKIYIAAVVCMPVLLFFSDNAVAISTCNSNSTPVSNCSNLFINLNTASIDVGVGVTVSNENGYSLEVQSGSNATLGMLSIEGSITTPDAGGGNSAIVNRSGNTISEIIVASTAGVSGRWSGIYNEWGPATIGTITNLGTVTNLNDPYQAIYNEGNIGTINNLQGVGNEAGALKFSGKLPTSYNMIVYGDQYGQFDVGGYSGQMTFGIFGGDAVNGIAASQLKSLTYQNVVTGVDKSAYDNSFNTSSSITSIYGSNGAAFGSYNGAAWILHDATYRESADTAWDLTVLNFGLDLAEPQRAMLEQRQQAIRNGLDHDCDQFDKDGLCVSVKARASGLGDEREGAGVLTVAKRIDTGFRIGGFIDERVSSNEVNGVQMKLGLPMFGAFAAYSAGKDGTGIQARVSAAYEHGRASISHNNMLGSASTVSGDADVDSLGVAQRIGWGFGIGNKNVITPYLGLRYTQAKRSAYAEAYDAGVVDDPFSFSAYGEHRVTGTFGADLNGHINDAVTYRLGAGVDYDFANDLDTFAAYSDLLGDMTYVNGLKARDKRLFGSAGIGYALEKNRTFTLDGNVSQMDYGSDKAYSLMAGYQMAF